MTTSGLNRRVLLKYTAGVALSYLNPLPYGLSSKAFADENMKDEQKKEELAKYVFNFGSPYFSSNHFTTPHAHHEIKELIEKYTQNRVYVKIV